MKNKFTKRAILTAMACMVPAMAMAAPVVSDLNKEVSQYMPKGKMSLQNDFTGTQADAKLGKFTLAEIEVNLDPSMEEKINVEDLVAMTPDYVEKEITINELNELMAKISMYCRSKGFAAATCYLPEQKAKYAIIHVDVVPGKYGEVRFENNSSLSEAALKKYAGRLKAGKVITTHDLETVLRNISDIGGIEQARGVLSPGAEVGTSDVTIQVNNGKNVDGIVYADNYGNANTGRYRYGVQANINRVNDTGMNVHVGGMFTNTSHGQKNYYANVETPVGDGNTVLGMGFSRQNYEVYNPVAIAGNTTGKSNTFSVYGKTSILNASDQSMKLVYGVDYKKTNSEYTIKFGGFEHTYKYDSHSTAARLGIEGSYRSAGSVLQYDITGYYGNFTPESDSAKIGAYASDYDGTYFKGVANARYIQSLGHTTDVMLRGQFQMAGHNLDSSEQMLLGGTSGVRAYPSNEVAGDQGVVGSMEFRYHNGHGLTYSTYLDAGTVNRRHNYSEGSRTLMGWGLGLTYFKQNDWYARFDYARRIGGDEELLSPAGKDKGRMWFTMGKLF